MAKAPPAVVDTVAKDWVPLLLAYVDSRTYAADGEVDSAVGVSGPSRRAGVIKATLHSVVGLNLGEIEKA